MIARWPDHQCDGSRGGEAKDAVAAPAGVRGLEPFAP